MNKKRTRKRLVILGIVALFYIPVIDPVISNLGEKAVITQIVLGSFRLIAAMLVYWIIRLTIWFVRRFSSEAGQVLELPPNAFQVRLNLTRLHVAGLIITAVVAVISVLAFCITWQGYDPPTAMFIFYFILLIVLHELFHAFGWIIRGIPIRSIQFGVMWHILAPYAHCRVDMPMTVYRFALILPLFATGLLPLGIGLWSRDFDLTVAGAILIGGAAGDLGMLLASIAFHPRSRVMDHPSEPSFIILDKGNLSPASGKVIVS